jgi:hypothetical protein
MKILAYVTMGLLLAAGTFFGLTYLVMDNAQVPESSATQQNAAPALATPTLPSATPPLAVPSPAPTIVQNQPPAIPLEPFTWEHAQALYAQEHYRQSVAVLDRLLKNLPPEARIKRWVTQLASSTAPKMTAGRSHLFVVVSGDAPNVGALADNRPVICPDAPGGQLTKRNFQLASLDLKTGKTLWTRKFESWGISELVVDERDDALDFSDSFRLDPDTGDVIPYAPGDKQSYHSRSSTSAPLTPDGHERIHASWAKSTGNEICRWNDNADVNSIWSFKVDNPWCGIPVLLDDDFVILTGTPQNNCELIRASTATGSIKYRIPVPAELASQTIFSKGIMVHDSHMLFSTPQSPNLYLYSTAGKPEAHIILDFDTSRRIASYSLTRDAVIVAQPRELAAYSLDTLLSKTCPSERDIAILRTRCLLNYSPSEAKASLKFASTINPNDPTMRELVKLSKLDPPSLP